jgi:hypothetical protein
MGPSCTVAISGSAVTISCPDGSNVQFAVGSSTAPFACASRADLWMPVTGTTADWVWSSERDFATVAAADGGRTLYTGDQHIGSSNTASLDGTGFVSTQVFTMNGCNADWYHIGGRFTGNCSAHDGDQVRRLVMNPDGCFDYTLYNNNGAAGIPTRP